MKKIPLPRMTVHTRFLSSFGFTIKFIFLKKKIEKKKTTSLSANLVS